VHARNRSVNVTVVIIKHKNKKRMLNVIKEITKTFEKTNLNMKNNTQKNNKNTLVLKT